MRKSPIPPRLLQIALDGAEARSIEAGTGPLGYRDCAVIANGVRPVLADLHAQVEALRTGFWASDYDAALNDVLALFDGTDQ